MPYPQLNYGIDAPMGDYDAYALGNVWQPPRMLADAGMPAAQNVPARQPLGGLAFIPGYGMARAQQAAQAQQIPQLQQTQQPNLGDLLRMMAIAVQQGETIPLTQRIALLGGGSQGGGSQNVLGGVNVNVNVDKSFLDGIMKGLNSGGSGGAMGGGMSLGM